MRCLAVLMMLTAPCSARGDQSVFRQFDAQADGLIAQMTLAEKVGQMTQADLASIDDFRVVGELFLGSVLSGGGSDPKDGNSLKAWTDVYDACQRAAQETRLAIPILYGVDAVHGHNNVLGAVVFPHNIGLGCTRNEQLVQQIGRLTALEVRATGVNWTFAPCITVPRDDRWGRTYEGFSENPTLAGALGAAAIRGLQGDDLANASQVLACAKHFAGDGGTTAQIREAGWPGFGEGRRLRLDQGDAQCTEDELRQIHVAPYLPAIESGVGSVMISYNSWNGVKCTGNKFLINDVLKSELGFEGLVISDWNAIDQVNSDYKTAIKQSINAGVDMAMVPDKYRQFIQLLTELVEEGEVTMERIDDAVRRILRVKAAMGLLDSRDAQLANRKVQAGFGSADRRAVARQAVRESLVLLKNVDRTLPIAKSARRIYVAGAAADDLGVQCGGWTIQWQGETGEVTSGGTTILEGLRRAAGDNIEVTFSADGGGVSGATVCIVVVGEQPYAEGAGDDEHLKLSDADIQTFRTAEQIGVPMVVVLLSGRPLVIDEVLAQADAVIAAWLPGTEGQGVAEVLLGDYRPTGKLSFSWPRAADQHPVNVGDADYDPRFEFGYGLTYGVESEQRER